MKSSIIGKITAAQHDNPIGLTVGANKLKLYEGSQWLLDSSDMDVAAAEIMTLIQENEKLKERCEKAERELKEALEVKRVSLSLLTEERLRTIVLEQEISGYKEELQKSFKEIISLRNGTIKPGGDGNRSASITPPNTTDTPLPMTSISNSQASLVPKMDQISSLLEFVADRDAKTIQKACAGLGTNDTLLISVICSRTKKQLSAANTAYRALYSDQTIAQTIQSECSGDYKQFLLYVSEPRAVYLCNQLSQAMDGIGCNHSRVNEIFCLSTTEEIFAMRAVFEKRYDTKLSDRLRGELSGEHETLILHLLMHGRGTGPVDVEKATEAAKKIHQDILDGRAMVGGLKESAKRHIGKVLCGASPQQCIAIQDAWEKCYPGSKSLQATLSEKLGGAFEEACLLLLTDPLAAWCEKMHAAMKGLGTNEATLSRALGGLDKPHAKALSSMYQAKYEKSLESELKSELSGYYLQAVLAWISAPDPTAGLEADLFASLASGDTYGVDQLSTRCIRNIKESIARMDVDLLHLATNGVGTDERLLISVLCARSKSDLKQVDLYYRETHKLSLRELIESETSGDVAKFLSYTQMKEEELDAFVLKKACDGLGTNERVIMEVVCSRSYERLMAAKQSITPNDSKMYRKYFESSNDRSLLDLLRSELSGTMDKVCCRLFKSPRHCSTTFNPGDLARELYAAGAALVGTNEDKFIDIFTSHSVEQLNEIALAYELQFDCSLEKAISSEFSGDARDILLLLLLSPVDIYCRALKKASIGQVGTDEEAVCRIIGGSEKELVWEIAQTYLAKYNRSLVEDLRGELSGDFRSAVLTYICTSYPGGGIAMLNQVDPPIRL